VPGFEIPPVENLLYGQTVSGTAYRPFKRMCLNPQGTSFFSKLPTFLGTVERQAGHFFRLTVTEADLKVSHCSLPLNT
jgi:hypothetical protein